MSALHPKHKRKNAAIAFFDYDGTLTLYDSTPLCALPSIGMGLLRPGAGLRAAAMFIGYKLRLCSRVSAHHMGFRCFRGRTAAEIEQSTHVLHERWVRRWYSAPMLAKVEEHRRRGDRLVIVTSTADFFPMPLARAWGFEHVIGTRLHYENGVCTGIVDGPIVEGDVKHRAALAYAQRLGIPLESCTFYSDHILDLPLLERVGTAVAVGPHRPLERVARERGWPIIGQQALAGLRA